MVELIGRDAEGLRIRYEDGKHSRFLSIPGIEHSSGKCASLEKHNVNVGSENIRQQRIP